MKTQQLFIPDWSEHRHTAIRPQAGNSLLATNSNGEHYVKTLLGPRARNGQHNNLWGT